MPRRDAPCTTAVICRECGAPILWVKWPKTGKASPVDEIPNDAGSILLEHRAQFNILEATHLGKHKTGPVPGRKVYMSHFDTCQKRTKKDKWDDEKPKETVKHPEPEGDGELPF